MKLVPVAAILLAAHTAAAKPTPAITAAQTLLDAQVAAINAHDAKVFAATFDAPAYLIFPTTLEANMPEGIETAAKTWLRALGKTTAKLDHVRIGEMSDTHCAWLSAEIVATGDTTVRWRVTEMIAPLQSIVAKPTAADYRVLAAEISEPMEGKDALAAKLPPLPENERSIEPGDYEAIPVKDLSTFAIANDPAVTFIGSAPKELVAGKGQFAAMLKAFERLDLKELSWMDVSDSNSNDGAGALFWHVQVTYKVDGKPVVIPYRALLIYFGAPMRHRPYTLVAVHFAIAQR